MFGRLFSYFKPQFIVPNIEFGRFNDAYKSDAQIDFWNEALVQFEEGNYIHAYEAFFFYLTDNKLKNVRFTVKKNEAGQPWVRFELRQGTNLIQGMAIDGGIWAQTTISKSRRPGVVLMRRLLEYNYELRYCRYLLTANDELSLRFDSKFVDGSPEKVYYALRELATHAQRQKALLETDNRTTSAADSAQSLPAAEKAVKFRYLSLWVERAFDLIEDLNATKNAEQIGKILVTTAFKIDFLLVPHGRTMTTVEEIQRIYNAPSKRSLLEKNERMTILLRQLQATTERDFNDELYRTTATFGITRPTRHVEVREFIERELPKTKGLQNDQQQAVQLYLLEFIAQYMLYFFGVQRPTQTFLQLIVRVLNDDFFTELGFRPSLLDAKRTRVARRQATALLRRELDRAHERYPDLTFDYRKLDFSSIPKFVEGFLLKIATFKYD